MTEHANIICAAWLIHEISFLHFVTKSNSTLTQTNKTQRYSCVLTGHRHRRSVQNKSGYVRKETVQKHIANCLINL